MIQDRASMIIILVLTYWPESGPGAGLGYSGSTVQRYVQHSDISSINHKSRQFAYTQSGFMNWPIQTQLVSLSGVTSVAIFLFLF